ncbi:RNA polymerase sigma-70 factor [Persicobacter diffluens]|uniref:DNA-directed RNA polymerase sigma-70 factor n=1 Tax=Persicobacter diffluens TaxID=981 RepID=A0AAN5ALX0_9BACT|nr:DNA-directed RNA polymerase sigma-70 factor [Persicobacter diffluens]
MKNNYKPNLNLIRNGDKAEFNRLYLAYYDMLLSFVGQYVDRSEDTENIVQDTFIKLWEYKEKLKEDSNLRNLLFTIGRNKALNFIRDNKHFIPQEDWQLIEAEMKIFSLQSLGENVGEFDELRNRYAQVLKSMPEEQKVTFMMSREEGLKYAEIAQALDVSVKTVEARISKALKLLRLKLAGFYSAIWFLSTFLS